MAKRPPRTRQSRARPGKNAEGAKYVAAGAVTFVGLFALAAIAWTYFTAPAKTSLDSVTGCPKDGPTSAHFVVIDSTDPLPAMSKIQVRNEIRRLALTLKKGELLELRTILPSSVSGVTDFSKCSPGDGSDLDNVTGNPEIARKRWQNEFIGPLDNLLSRLQFNQQAEKSPILETFQAIAVESIIELRHKNIPTTLRVVSDMRQHSDIYSHYKGDFSYDSYKKTEAYRNLHTDFGGSDFTIYYVQRRQPPIDERAHITFWQDWANDNGATLIRVERLQGVN